MGKLIFQEWISLDGYAADENNALSFVEELPMTKYSDQEQLDFLNTIDSILLGANTYQMFIQFWPTATNDIEVIADKLNSLPKIVFSRSIQKAPWGKWPEATIVKTNAAEAVIKMKSEKVKNLVLWGSISLAQYFMKENLIDEYHLRICPVLLGSGKPLFGNSKKIKLELFENKAYPSGLMLLKYRTVKAG
jgi:dihydrofolate reductase